MNRENTITIRQKQQLNFLRNTITSGKYLAQKYYRITRKTRHDNNI